MTFLKSARAMSSDELQKSILSTYFTLRMGIVVLSMMLPLILYFGGIWWGGIHNLARSCICTRDSVTLKTSY